MKLLNRSSAIAFTGTSKDYITKDAVKRANDRLINNAALENSIFELHGITRPTREQLVEAAQRAMRKVTVHG